MDFVLLLWGLDVGAVVFLSSGLSLLSVVDVTVTCPGVVLSFLVVFMITAVPVLVSLLLLVMDGSAAFSVLALCHCHCCQSFYQ